MIKTKSFIPIISFILFILLWQIIVTIKNYPAFLLPSPFLVFNRFILALNEDRLLFHSFITLKEIVLGLLLGFWSAFIIGYFSSKSKIIYLILSPLLISFQAIPIVALAPIIIILLGAGLFAKSFVAASTLFFPVLINTITGFRHIDNNLNDLMLSLEASSWQKLIYLEIPASLTIIFSGLKIGVVLSVIGAVVGEFVGADRGLGFLVNLAGGLYDTPLRFVAFFTLSFIALSLYGLVSILERQVIKWKK